MTEKELRKLSRVELLEMLSDQSVELKNCREKLAEAESALQKRQIVIDNAGSIAEASMQLSGIFDAAQLACRDYTENLRQLNERQKTVCAELEAESRAKADQLINEARQKSEDMMRDTKAECDAMRRKAQEDARQYWDEVSAKLEAFYDARNGLRELMSAVTQSKV